MSKAKFPPDELISTAQAAAELGIGVNRMLVLLNTGRLPAKRLGKFWLIRYADLDLVRDRPHGRPRTRTPGPRPAANAKEQAEATAPAPKKTKKKK